MEINNPHWKLTLPIGKNELKPSPSSRADLGFSRGEGRIFKKLPKNLSKDPVLAKIIAGQAKF